MASLARVLAFSRVDVSQPTEVIAALEDHVTISLRAENRRRHQEDINFGHSEDSRSI